MTNPNRRMVAAPRTTKIQIVTGLLGRNDGASIEEIVEATGWLPHSTRAALTSLKKKGYPITRSKPDGVTRYAITRTA